MCELLGLPFVYHFIIYEVAQCQLSNWCDSSEYTGINYGTYTVRNLRSI